jgi:hypothetical protein
MLRLIINLALIPGSQFVDEAGEALPPQQFVIDWVRVTAIR